MGPETTLGVFNNSVHAVERALLERYFLCKVGDTYVPPLPVNSAAYDTQYLDEFRRKLSRYARSRVRVLSLREVVKCYTGAKRKVYERAYAELMQGGLQGKDSKLRPFTKFEKQDTAKAPRIINPRHPRYTLTLGKYLKKSEKVFFKGINKLWGKRTDHTVIKGLNVEEAGEVLHSKWMRFSNPVAVGLDAVKFDMHVSVPALEYEHSVYNRAFHSPLLRCLLQRQLINKGVAHCPDGVVKFLIPGTRSSGDLNTSLGNCVLMCALVYAFCQEKGIDAELANNGDDCVVFMEEEDLAHFRDGLDEWFATRGFRMTVEEPVREFEQLEFCQSHPIWNGLGWCMVRNPVTCMKKDPMCLLPMTSPKAFAKWMWAVGKCGMSLVPGIPVMGAFYRCFARHGVRTTARHIAHIFKTTSMMERINGMSDVVREITPLSRSSFYAATGITPDYQRALEAYYDNLSLTTALRSVVEDVRISPPFLWHL